MFGFLFVAKVPYMFGEDLVNTLPEDGALDQTVPNMSSPNRTSPTTQSGVERMERYSRKVFVGGLPPDIDEGQYISLNPSYQTTKF